MIKSDYYLFNSRSIDLEDASVIGKRIGVVDLRILQMGFKLTATSIVFPSKTEFSLVPKGKSLEEFERGGE